MGITLKEAYELKITDKKGEVYTCLVDAEDYEYVSQFKWHVQHSNGSSYANRAVIVNGRQTTRRMHREILGLSNPKIFVDHINHNGLDNRRGNLRLCTNTENLRNRRPRKNASSQYRGVTWHKAKSVWRAFICQGKKTIHLGCFQNENQAALAYNKAALEAFGEFAYQNQVEEGK